MFYCLTLSAIADVVNHEYCAEPWGARHNAAPSRGPVSAVVASHVECATRDARRFCGVMSQALDDTMALLEEAQRLLTPPSKL